MKNIIFYLIIVASLAVCSCKSASDESIDSNFEGIWGIVADYTNEDGYTYYYSDYYHNR